MCETGCRHTVTQMTGLMIHSGGGKNKDGYFRNEHLAAQTKSCMKVFDILHPGCTGLFLFDNSQNHHAFADDALVASRLNLSDGGKKVRPMRDGYFVPEGARAPVQQKMQHADGTQKGVKAILKERVLWPDNGMLLQDARALLAQQPDFIAQLPLLEETISNHTGHDHILDFYPKFHPEFNFIEMYWGACKRYARVSCDYTWAGLCRVVPEALKSVSLSTIRKFWRKSARYMDAYSEKNGMYLTTAQVEYAVKKYSSHRRVPSTIMEPL